MASYQSSNSHLHQQSQQQQSYPQEYAQDNYTSSVDGSQQQQASGNLQPGRFTEEWDASQRGSSIIEGRNGTGSNMQRTTSVHSYNPGDDQQMQTALPSRGNTLKKKNSMRRAGSLSRSGSRRSMRAGSVKSLALNSASDPDEAHSAFFCPIPTSGNPTEVLVNRFQSWRKVLKDLIAYFREIQSHYENRGKALLKLANVSNNISSPPNFLRTGGIDDALQFLRAYNKNAIIEANKAKEIEEDVILALTGLRSDLQQKIKEIKNLSGDFKNSVEKEMENTRKAVRALQDVLGKNEADDASAVGKQDPFLMRMTVDRQVERQLDEENYLHQAYLNLENSGRELESIVVGEIQKAYNAYAGILKREAENAFGVVEELRDGPVSMPKDHEWIHFVTHDDQFVDPKIPLRSAEQIHYPGQSHVAAQEIRAGLLERKSKYLRSYTAGWYVLSTTHLHEFKSADKGQAPVMSLYLPEQKLGSHSTEGGSSNKFILKGRQTGAMHRGHTWVFRAESHDTMMAWYEDIKVLTEKTPEERNQFVRHHSRSLSQSSRRSASSDGGLDDEDEEPFSADSQINVNPGPKIEPASRRSQPGGRFPSDIQVNAQRGLQATRSPSSLSSHGGQEPQNPDFQTMAAAGALPGSGFPQQTGYDNSRHGGYGEMEHSPVGNIPAHATIANQEAQHDGVNPYTSEPMDQSRQQTYRQTDTFVAPVMIPQDTRQQQQVYGNEMGQDLDKTGYLAGGQSQYQNEHGFAVASKAQQANGNVAGGNVNVLTAGGVAYSPIERDTETDTMLSSSTGGYLASDGLPTPTGGQAPKRPTSNTTRNDSVNTISNLHIPGGYPRPNIV